jgi:predicted permease
MLTDFVHRVRSLFRRRKVEVELDDELRFHVDRQAEKHAQSGISSAEARRRANLEFGGMDRAREESRDARGTRWLEDTWQDVRHGLRMWRKSPGFTIVAILTLALGIGANTAIFSVVNGVLLNPLPFPKPDQLVTIDASKPNFARGSISYPNFIDWHQYNRSFSYFAVSRSAPYLLTGVGEAEELTGALITSDFFPMLGIKPVLGRWFTPAEDVPGAASAVAISTDLWQRKFRSEPDIIGHPITLDGKGYTIVGVFPSRIDLTRGFADSKDIYMPLAEFTNPVLMNRGAGLGIHGIARLKPGVTIEQARADMQGVTNNLAKIYPQWDQGTGATILPLKEALVGSVRQFLLLLLGAVGLVLLIACVNVANLLLARGTSRNREMAVRAALGAGTPRLIRQMLTESVLLALGGGAFGLLLAVAGTKITLASLPADLPRTHYVGMDAHVLWFTALLSFFAGILFGIIPAVRTARRNFQETLKEGSRGSVGSRQRAQGALVAVQMAMALVLLIGAGLLLRSLAALWQVDPGFNPDNVTVFNLALAPQMLKASPAAIRADLRNFTSSISATRGVEALSLSWGAVPMYNEDDTTFWIEGRPKPSSDNDANWTLSYTVGADFLRVMRIPLLSGRFFTSQDDERSKNVCVIDDVLAKKYFPNGDAIGHSIHTGDSPAYEIIGVIGHVKQWGLDSDDTNSLRAQMYFAYDQLPDNLMSTAASSTTAVLRSNETVPNVMDEIRSTSRQISPDEVIYGATTMHEVIETSLASNRFAMMLLGTFAAIAMLLAGIGLYGVISYLVGQRTNEIGIRMALGARRGDVLNWVLGQGTRLAIVGVAIGLVAAAMLTRVLASQSLLFKVSAHDPLTFAAVAIMLLLVALAACLIPAWRAARVDPITALRHE